MRAAAARPEDAPPRPARRLAALLWLAFAAPGAAGSQEAGGGHLSSDPRLVEARVLVEQQRWPEALAWLRPLASVHPDRTDALFLLGLAAAGAAGGEVEEARGALLAEAVQAFRAILIDRPGLVRVRLELARAFFLKREDSLAREHFKRVLAGNPPPPMAANIRRFLAAMQARRYWSANIGAMVAPDSNINRGSDEKIVYIYGLPFRLNAPVESRSGAGVSVWGGGEYRHPLSARLQLRAGASASRTEYAGGDFDRMSVSPWIGPHWRIGRDAAASLLATAGRNWRAGAPESSSRGLRLEAARALGRHWRVEGAAEWRRRHWRRKENKRLDGPEGDLSLGALWRITPALQARFAAGRAWTRPEDAPQRDSDGLRWRLGASAALPAGFTVSASGEWRRTDYAGLACCPPTRDDRPRADRARTLRLAAFNRGWTLLGFSPQIGLVRTRLETNTQAAGYKSNRIELRLLRQF